MSSLPFHHRWQKVHHDHVVLHGNSVIHTGVESPGTFENVRNINFASHMIQ
jgi:hypothetical protein